MAKSVRALLLLVLLTVLDSIISAQPSYASDTQASATRSQAPYFLLLNGDPEVDHFPLLSTTADVTVSGVIADVRVKQTYKNAGRKAIEAVYVFPASTRAAVYGMKMTIGERTVVAQIQEREQARQAYQEAQQQGKSASLLEQQRPNVFQMSVANLMPGDLITVELSYTELLVPADSIYELVFPTVVGPRYVGSPERGSAVTEDFTANPTLPAGLPPTYDLALTVHLEAGMPLFDVASPSHRIQVAHDGATRAEVRLDPTERAGGNRDFILRYRLAGDRIASGLVLTKGQEGGSFLLMVQPPRQIKPAQLPPREYVFIMDVSGSMHGFPLETSKRLIGDLVSALRPIDSFNIVLFENSSRALAERSVPASRHNLRAAQCFIDSHVGAGGTELLPALQRALNLPRTPGASRTVVLATDGLVRVEAEAMRVAQQNLGNANLFVFGIGHSVNRFLIEALARVGRGEPAIVLDENEAAERAEKFRRYIEAPVLTDIKVEFDGFQTSEVEPESVPDAFTSRPVIVFGKWSGEPHGRVVVRGSTGGQPFEQSFDVAGIKIADDDHGLRKLWARSRIEGLGDLEALHDRIDHKKEITELGLQNNLLTRYTSFVAIDSQIRNVEGDSTTIRQPLPMPQGLSNLAVGGYEAVPRHTRSGGADDEPLMRVQSSPDGVKVLWRHRYEPSTPRGLPRFMVEGDALEMDAGAAMNVAPNHLGEPVRTPFSVGYGATWKLAMGLHSREGLCVTGGGHGCSRFFNQLGADLVYALDRDEDGGRALRVGVSLASFDPLWPRLALGAPVQFALARQRLFLRLEPGVEWGLVHTDVNSAAFILPVQLQLLAFQHRSGSLSVYASTGVQAAWMRPEQRYAIPVGLGLQLALARWLDVAAELSMVAKAGSEMPEAARRIFYDTAATVTPSIYDRSLLLHVRLHEDTGRLAQELSRWWAVDEDEVDGEAVDDDPRERIATPQVARRAPAAPPACEQVEW
jgi:Ca-activated chloride channel homolog